MHTAAFNSDLIRPLLIVLFLVITQILRAAKMSKTAKPSARTGADTAPAAAAPKLTNAFREAMRRRAEQARSQQGGQPVQAEPTEAEPPQFVEGFQQPPFQQPATIQPESSIVPSLLLLALLACLCLMAYRYWAG
jgi:hypothetical protein